MMVLVNGEGQIGMPAGVAALRAGKPALDIVEAAIRPVEADPGVHSVGRGGFPNLLGEVECDACIMDGLTLQTGAVAALRGYLHAISIARELIHRLPHVLLVGDGADRFAREIHAERTAMLTAEMQSIYRAWIDRHVTPEERASLAQGPLARHTWASTRAATIHGTTICLTRDAHGNLGAGVSSSGWPYKYPGRVGDSAVIGAGLYADNRYGACGCTHTGEMTIRAGTARAVVLYMKGGAAVDAACHEAVADLRALRGGLLGPVTIHAIDRDGAPYVVSTVDPGHEPPYCLWTEGMAQVEMRNAERVS